jgi:hypothetical protein
MTRETFNVVREMQKVSSAQSELLEKLSKDHQRVLERLSAVEAQYVLRPQHIRT